MPIDPVCGMHLAPATAALRRYTETGTFFFCSAHCVATFGASPGRYPAPAANGTHEGRESR